MVCFKGIDSNWNVRFPCCPKCKISNRTSRKNTWSTGFSSTGYINWLTYSVILWHSDASLEKLLSGSWKLPSSGEAWWIQWPNGSLSRGSFREVGTGHKLCVQESLGTHYKTSFSFSPQYETITSNLSLMSPFLWNDQIFWGHTNQQFASIVLSGPLAFSCISPPVNLYYFLTRY